MVVAQSVSEAHRIFAPMVGFALLSATLHLTSFVTQSALREAEAVVEAAEVIKLSERDYMRVLDLLENPRAANAKLIAAA